MRFQLLIFSLYGNIINNLKLWCDLLTVSKVITDPFYLEDNFISASYLTRFHWLIHEFEKESLFKPAIMLKSTMLLLCIDLKFSFEHFLVWIVSRGF